MSRTYVYSWTETDEHGNVNGPYEVSGNALSIYRANVMISTCRPHVDSRIFSDDAALPFSIDAFMAECTLLLFREHPIALPSAIQTAMEELAKSER